MKSLLPVTFIFLISACRPAEVPLKIKSDLDSIVFKWVPDNREGICNINLRLFPGDKILIKGETDIPGAKNEIINYITESGFEYYDSLQVLPDPAVTAKSWGLVTVCVCNIKKYPSHSSELVSQAVMGTPVRILKNDEDWLLVQTPDYYIGWTNDSGITELDDKEIDEWKQSERLIFLSKSGDILSRDNDTEVISDIVSGAILKISEEQKDTYITELPDGRKGRIRKENSGEFNKWCSEIKPESDRLISFAKSLKGTSYLWGGTSTKMTDCSGFVKTVYFTGGIILARDASQQFLYGKKVDISSSFDSLQPGDQVFFGHLNSSGNKIITHTGLYIGDTEIIHESGMVRVNSLDSTRSNYSRYLRKTIMGARRIIGTPSGRGTGNVALHKWYH